MSHKVTRTFRFNIPSVFPLNWEFEFHCELEFLSPQVVVVKLEEHTTGSRRFEIQDCGVTWKTLMWTWHTCAKIAFKHVVEWNNKDESVRRSKRINERGIRL